MTQENRKVILDLAVSLDGYIEGPNGEYDWCIMEPEMNFGDFLNSMDTILFGRKSYELWKEFEQSGGGSDEEVEMLELQRAMKRFVFSRSMTSLDDEGAEIISDDLTGHIQRLKSEPGKNIWLYGGASLLTDFVNFGLVDVYQLSVHPIVLGAGKPLFSDIKQRVGLTLTDVKRYNSGVVQLCYSKTIF